MGLHFFRPCLLFLFVFIGCYANNQPELIVGAEQPEQYIPILKNKKIGMVVNHTSMAFNSHLVDFLLDQDITVQKIFSPEHGFRGNAARGVELDDEVDQKTGIPIISIYGKNKKPSSGQLKGVDVVVFDIQDVGCRFYTYVSTLFYVMEACAENDIPLLVLDRPNPNGEYISGPLMKEELKSFVGLLPIPVVHGCTIGEMAKMINGENWCGSNVTCNLTVIPVKGYSHLTQYEPPVLPSPNLPNLNAIKLYPYLCFFEATSISVGRGTDIPFQVLGFPDPSFGDFTFTPQEIQGVAKNPLHEGELCYGKTLGFENMDAKSLLAYFIEYYNKFSNEGDFLTRENWFNLLVGNQNVLELIKEGKSADEIELTWVEELNQYKKIRKKYILYPDFE